MNFPTHRFSLLCEMCFPLWASGLTASKTQLSTQSWFCVLLSLSSSERPSLWCCGCRSQQAPALSPDRLARDSLLGSHTRLWEMHRWPENLRTSRTAPAGSSTSRAARWCRASTQWVSAAVGHVYARRKTASRHGIVRRHILQVRHTHVLQVFRDFRFRAHSITFGTGLENAMVVHA
jgi:hypothetical protein